MNKTLLFSLVTLSSLYAETTDKNKIEGTLALSYVQVSGNTNTKNFSSKLEAQKDIQDYTIFANADSLLIKDGDTETSNKTNLTLKLEKKIDDLMFTYFEANYIKDKFSGYDYRANIGPGVGYKILNSDIHKLKVSLGVYYSIDKESSSNVTNEFLSGNAELKYDRKINEQVKLNQDIIYSPSFDNPDKYFATSLTGVKVKMNETLSIGVSYKVEYQSILANSEVEHIDKTFLTSLIIGF